MSKLGELEKAIIGIVVGIIGGGLVFFKAITPDTITEWVLIVVGIALIGGYCFISWKWFKKRFGKDATFGLLTPPLITFGVLAVYISLTTNYIPTPHDKVFLGLGVALVIIPLVLLVRALQR